MAPTDPQAVLDRLHGALNQHDLDAFVACFAPTYQSEQPLHPDRAFVGSDQVRKNWSRIFQAIPNLEAELLRSAVVEETVWAEWYWHGTQQDGTPWHQRGVTLFGVRDNRIVWGRLYMEPVQAAGQGIDAAVGTIVKPAQA